MSTIQIRLFGPLQLQHQDTSLPLPSSVTARSLLAYLITHHDRPCSRDLLVGLFWPERSDTQARRALSNALWQIRGALGPAVKRLVTEGDAVSFLLHPSDWVDVEAFQRICTSASPKPAPHRTSQLQRAAELYRADFLEDIYHDWALIERERLREMYLSALDQLVALYKQSGDFERALIYAQRLVAADPLRESAHRELMRLYHLLNRSRAALQQFANLSDLLEEELGVPPTPATAALYREIATALKELELPYIPIAPPPPPLLSDLAHLPFVGRTSERTTLLAALQRTIRGQGGIALVEGDTGVGKTRLVNQIAADAEWRGMQVGAGKAEPLATAAPHQLLRDALLPLLTPLRVAQLAELIEPLWLSAAAPVLPVIAERLPDLPALPILEPDRDRQRLWQAIAHCLSALASIVPLLLILEDLHWADAATLATLPHLASRSSDSRMLLVLTCRSAEARERAAVWEALQALDQALPGQRLRLRPFERAEAMTLVQRALGTAEIDTPTTAFAERLRDKTGGNPLFLVETLKSLLEQNALSPTGDDGWTFPAQDQPLSTPASIQGLIRERLVRLTSPLRKTLEWVAVLGEDADFPILSQASQETAADLAERLETLCRRGFLLESGTGYHFEHDLVRQVTYQSIPPEQTQRLHLQAGAILEKLRHERLESLAHHFYLGEVWDKATDYNQQAGDRAGAAYANEEAVTHYTRALQALNHPAQPASPIRRFEILLARESVHHLQGKRKAQADDLAELHDLAEELSDNRKRAMLALQRARYHEALSDYLATAEAAQKAAEWANQANDLALNAQAHIAWGRVFWLQNDYEQARIHYERALALSQAIQDQPTEADCLQNLGALRDDLASYPSARQYLKRALDIRRTLGDRQGEAETLNSLGNTHSGLGEYEICLDYYKQSLAIKREIGNQHGQAHTLYNMSTSYRELGDGERARQCCERATQIARALGDRRLEAYTLTYLGLILEKLHTSEPASKANLETAEAHYVQALEIRRQIGQPALMMDSQAGLARTLLTQGRVAEALEQVDEILSWIAANGTAGIGDAILVYQTAYRVLSAAGEAYQERARAALTDGHNLLLAWAAKLDDEAARRSLFEAVWPNYELVATYRAMQVESQQAQTLLARLPHVDAPTGRPLRADEWVEVDWTLSVPEDDEIPDEVERRRRRILRLLAEAAERSAAPTIKALAQALDVSQRTVKRDLAALRATGHPTPTRGART